MKLYVVFTSLILGVVSASAASIQWNQDSQIPADLQKEIESSVAAKCRGYHLVEITTAVKTKKDGDKTYKTSIKAEYQPDGIHPSEGNILVVSGVTADRHLEVHSVSSSDTGLCD